MRKALTVGELTALIKTLIEGEPALTAVSVVGEVSGLKISDRGHVYFTLKDKSSSIRCTWFGAGSKAAKALKDGEEVVASGSVTVYAPRGEYSLSVSEVVPKGLGSLAAAFEKLKEKLRNEGLFDESRKVPIPALPRRIAIITSPTAAALQDILNIHNKNAPHVEIRLFPSLVQGDSAPAEIMRALARVERDASKFNLLIIARGGGSIEDLWCFNDENLARAIADLAIPTICGVGHESDVTIADFVADLRAPTPTAAMEIATGKWPIVLSEYAAMRDRLPIWIDRKVRSVAVDFERAAEMRAIRALLSRVDDASRALDDGYEALLSVHGRIDESRKNARVMLDSKALGAFARVISDYEREITRIKLGSPKSAADLLEKRVESITAMGAKLDACDYEKQLRRGFSVVTRTTDGEIVTSPETVSDGDGVEIRAGGGAYKAVVDKKP